MNDTRNTQEVRVEITWKSVIRVLLAVLLANVALTLLPIVKGLVLATLVAVALYPVVRWSRRRGWPRWAGVLLASAALTTTVIGCFAIIGPIVFSQAASLGENLPKLREQIISQLPPSGVIRQALENGMSSGTVADSRLVLQKTMLFLETTAGGLFSFVVVLVLAVYLIADGPRALKWLIVFFPVEQRRKLSQTFTQIGELISAYVMGQFLVSACCAAYLFLLLTTLSVSRALLLGILAGILDVVPIIGFFVAVSLAMLMGLAVSPTTAVLIFVLYGVYHLFENFFLVPKVYGRKLKLSKLAVPLAVTAGGLIAGVVGAIAVLPLVAAYPVVERLWLAPRLAPDTVKAHEESSDLTTSDRP
jgi:predicted PurR-regulated permease PerM